MSLQDDLTSVQRNLDDLVRSVGRLEQQIGKDKGNGLDIRRVRTDAEHLRESVALLRETTAQNQPSSRPAPELITIPDTPYDSALWTDAEDEGLGARDRHAP